MNSTIKLLTCLVLLSTSFVTRAQTVTLAVEATFPSEQATFVYEPLKRYLESKTGFTVNIEVKDNYYFYWRAAKNETPEFTLDASHVAAYRMEEKGYIPVATVQEEIRYHLISDFEPAEGQAIDAFLVGKSVVMLPNPNMASLLFDQWFTDLFLQPTKVVSALSWEDVMEQVFAQTAQAAIVPSSVYEIYSNLLELKVSDPMPGLTFLAAPHVDSGTRENFKKAIMAIGETDETFDILAELNTDGFIEVDKEKYKDLSQFLTRLLY
ncbi:phosphate/phosphite/phosphonate ABC transporter substrate-binding protein [Marinicella rhabdoformis]|uniref:phosphate/phosphite/phosphonate ABC transporter substrate-binding protein n=1 Tax=Marinicella rhabdoformis TaxID=2580566 RepID=UPI0012AEB4D2|nr:PhnD/SsuA/transferrin family substrate-binding protein [Marinicella rhabdoformis]